MSHLNQINQTNQEIKKRGRPPKEAWNLLETEGIKLLWEKVLNKAEEQCKSRDKKQISSIIVKTEKLMSISAFNRLYRGDFTDIGTSMLDKAAHYVKEFNWVSFLEKYKGLIEESLLKRSRRSAEFKDAWEKLHYLSDLASKEVDVVEEPKWEGRKREKILLSELYIEREIETQIKEAVAAGAAGRGLIFVSGEAGCGKTSLLWHLYNHYKSQPDTEAWFIKSIFLRDTSMSALFPIVPEDATAVVFIDTIDLLLHSEPDRLALVGFLEALIKKKYKCIATSRPQELTSVETINDGRYRIFKILDYNEKTELPQAIRKYGKVYYENLKIQDIEPRITATIKKVGDSRPLKRICLNPLTNRMFFSISAPNEKMPDINVFNLYTVYWQRRVVTDMRAGQTLNLSNKKNTKENLSETAQKIALLMLSQGNVSLSLNKSIHDFNQLHIRQNDIDSLISRGIFRRLANKDEIEFFHQTFFEHACAQALITHEDDPIELIDKRIKDQLEDYDPGSTLFISPILEHVLLLAEKITVHRGKSIAYTKELLSSDIGEKLRTGFYVYALFEKEYQDFFEMLSDRIRQFTIPESVYIKRFLNVASWMEKSRFFTLFDYLEIIWKRDLWNEQCAVIELLSYTAQSTPLITLSFLKNNQVIGKWQQKNGNGAANQHPVIYEDLVRALFQIMDLDYTYISSELLKLASSNDKYIKRTIVKYALASEALDNISFLHQLFTSVLVVSKPDPDYPDGKQDDLSILSDVLIGIWAKEPPNINDLVEFVYKKRGVKQSAYLMALAKHSHTISETDAERIFRLFKALDKTYTGEVYRWCNLMVPFITNHNEENHLFMWFYHDIFGHLKEIERNEGFDKVFLDAYVSSFSKMTFETAPEAYMCYEVFFTDKKYLSRYQELGRLLVYAYVNGSVSARECINNCDDNYFIKNNDLCKKILTVIISERLFNDDLGDLFMRLALLQDRVSHITTLIVRLTQADSPIKMQIPLYISDRKEKLYQTAILKLESVHQDEKKVGLQLLGALIKASIINKMPPFEKIEEWVKGFEKEHSIKSRMIDLYPFIPYDSKDKLLHILDRCRRDFENSGTNVRNKARLAFLTIINESPVHVDDLKEDIWRVFYDDMDADMAFSRIKLLSKMIRKFADADPEAGYYFFLQFITSEEFNNSDGPKQNAYFHAMYGACRYLCTKINRGRIFELVDILHSAGCAAAKLILSGITFNRFELVKNELIKISSSHTTEPCVEDRITGIIRFKLNNFSSNEWPEILYTLN